jgi:CheY-like chemotaxis protein
LEHRILIVGLDRSLFARIDPLLSRSLFAVDRVSRGESGVALAEHVAFDLIVLRYPLPDMELLAFLGAVRKSAGPNARTELLMLADAAAVEGLRSHVPSDPGRVVSLAEPWTLLQELAARLPGVELRVATRLLIRLEFQVADGRELVLCPCENISAGGMLLKTDRLHPIGTQVSFEAQLPGDHEPLQGTGEVVRHAEAEVEGVRGMGILYVGFRGDGLDRLKAFLRRGIQTGG